MSTRLANRIRVVEHKTVLAFARWLNSAAAASDEAPLDPAARAQARRELAEMLGVAEEELPP